MRKALINIYIKLVADRWSLGFIEEPLEDIVDGKQYTIHYVSGIPKDRWYADPFILNYNEEKIELLVEEWKYCNHKGRIARLVIDRQTYSLLQETVILELETHLSFPFIQRKDDKIYVSPENSKSGVWNMYEYNREADQLVYVKTVIDEPLTDAITTNLFGQELTFSTCLPNPRGSILSVYSNGVKQQDLHFDSNIARGAGDWFKVGEQVYRAAQDCNGGYGKAVIIQKVDKQESSFVFKDILRIESTHPRFRRGCHTFNHYKNLTVIDVFGYKNHLVGTTTDFLKNTLNNLLKFFGAN